MSKEYRVEEVNSGLCTCTLRSTKAQSVLNDFSRKGWEFEAFEAVTGRRCGFFPSPKLFIVFSRENGCKQTNNEKSNTTCNEDEIVSDNYLNEITAIVCSSCFNEFSPKIVNGHLVN